MCYNVTVRLFFYGDFAMNEDTEKVLAEENEEAPDEGRPPVDPNNKLYTFISLLIFAVIYFGGGFIKDSLTLTKTLYSDKLSEADIAAVSSEMTELFGQWDKAPDYVRLHKNFDGNSLYIGFTMPHNEDDTDEIAMPFPCGYPESDIRLTVYPEADAVPDYVYGDRYVCTDDPRITCMVYEEDDYVKAVFRIADYSGSMERRITSWEKIVSE